MFNDMVNKRLDVLSGAAIAEIWALRYSGRSREFVAGRFHEYPAVIDFANRRFQAKLDEIVDRQWARFISDPKHWEEVGVTTVADENDIPLGAARYVRAAVRNKLSRGLEELSQLAGDAAWVSQQISRRTTDWEEGFYRSEFTRGELRVEKGSIVGLYSELYDHCRCFVSVLTNPTADRRVIEEFLRLAHTTFANRKDRQRTFAKRQREENERREAEKHLPVWASIEEEQE